MTIMSQFSRTGLQGSLDSPKSPPVVHHVPESHEHSCWALSDCEQRPFIPHASSTFLAYSTFKTDWIQIWSWLDSKLADFKTDTIQNCPDSKPAGFKTDPFKSDLIKNWPNLKLVRFKNGWIQNWSDSKQSRLKLADFKTNPIKNWPNSKVSWLKTDRIQTDWNQNWSDSELARLNSNRANILNIFFGIFESFPEQ